MVEECLWLAGGEGLMDKEGEVLVVAVLQMIEERGKEVARP